MKPRERPVAWLMLTPALLVILGAIGYPMLRTLYLSFTDSRLTAIQRHTNWVGLSNYLNALSSPAFQDATKHTAYFVLVSVGLELVLGVLVALLLNQRFLGRTVVRVLLVIPLALPTVVNAMMWRWIYNPDFGAFNALLTQSHFLPEYRSWLGEPAVAMNMVILADVWKNYPLIALAVLAALQLIPKEFLEAAVMDGAGAWARFWRILWPGILPALSVAAVIRTIDAVKVFDIIYVMTRGGPADATKTLSFLVYQEGFSNLRTGSAAAYAYLVVSISLVLIALYILLLRRQERLV
jgi:multiple sugar transport system permease protein